MTVSVPLLLGMADRGMRRGLHTDLLGVGSTAILPFYPQNLHGLVLLLAVRTCDFVSGRLFLVDKTNPGRFASLDLNRQASDSPSLPSDNAVSRLMGEPVRSISSEGNAEFAVRLVSCPYASHVLMALPCPPLLAVEPGQYEVQWEAGGARTWLGNISLGFVEYPPLGEEEKRALLANPAVSRVIQFQVRCVTCCDQLDVFETIDESLLDTPAIPHGAIRIPSLHEEWACRCGATHFATKWLKAGVRFLFRNQPRTLGTGTASLCMPYQHTGLAAVAAAFSRVVANAQKEEELQSFIERNPIIWSFLAPKKILHKPRILTHHTADFGVLTAHKILHLVEIEKPSTSLATRKGGRHSEVQQPFNQIRDWRRVVANHKLSLLSELGLSEREVASIRFIAIAGRSTDDAARLRDDVGADTTFLTFDELGAHLTLLQSQLAGL